MTTGTKSPVSRTKLEIRKGFANQLHNSNRSNMPKSSARVDTKGRLPRHSAGKPGNNDRKGGAGKGNWCGRSLPSPQTDLSVQGFRDGLRSGRLAHGPKRSTLRGLNNPLDNGTGPSSLVAPVDDATLWMTATLRFQARPPNDN